MSRKSGNTKSTKDVKDVVAAFKALSNETRLGIFEKIRLGRAKASLNQEIRPSVCNVASNFDISLSTIPITSRSSAMPTLSAANGRARRSFDSLWKKPSG